MDTWEVTVFYEDGQVKRYTSPGDPISRILGMLLCLDGDGLLDNPRVDRVELRRVKEHQDAE